MLEIGSLFNIVIYGGFILFWLAVFIYDCIKNDKLPDIVHHIKTYWWVYALCIFAAIMFLVSLSDEPHY